MWFSHPDSTVDRCCLPIATIQETIALSLELYFAALLDEVKDADLRALDAMQDVVMVGYSNRRWDHVIIYHS